MNRVLYRRTISVCGGALSRVRGLCESHNDGATRRVSPQAQVSPERSAVRPIASDTTVLECLPDTIDRVPDDPSSRFRSHLNYIESFALLGGLALPTTTATAIERLSARARPLLTDAPPPA